MISQIIRAMQLMIVLRIKEAPFKYCIYTNKALKKYVKSLVEFFISRSILASSQRTFHLFLVFTKRILFLTECAYEASVMV